MANNSGVYFARTYNWNNTGVMTGNTVVTTEFAVPENVPDGTYSLFVSASGLLSTPVSFSFEATPAQKVRHLLDLVNSQWKRPQPLLANLNAALASIDRGHATSAINQLQAFLNQVRAQVAPSNPTLAATLLQITQNAINRLKTAQH
jgi:hypothetical protein